MRRRLPRLPVSAKTLAVTRLAYFEVTLGRDRHLYALIVGAGNSPRVGDGVDQATLRASQSFPYLATPNPDPPDRDHGIPTSAAQP